MSKMKLRGIKRFHELGCARVRTWIRSCRILKPASFLCLHDVSELRKMDTMWTQAWILSKLLLHVGHTLWILIFLFLNHGASLHIKGRLRRLYEVITYKLWTKFRFVNVRRHWRLGFPWKTDSKWNTFVNCVVSCLKSDTRPMHLPFLFFFICHLPP